MVGLYAIGIVRYNEQKPIFLEWEVDLSSFNYFQRSTANEIMLFFANEAAKRTAIGERRQIEEDDYLCFAWFSAQRLGVVIVAPKDYPPLVAFSLARKALHAFTDVHLSSVDPYVKTPVIADLLKKYQNPHSADALERASTDVEEVKIILCSTLSELYERGERIDDLVARSEHLSKSTKYFLTQTRRNNQGCCGSFT